jgi:peptidoglycan/xylan/chitin deacetylase (PgdA/CDA1 family)
MAYLGETLDVTGGTSNGFYPVDWEGTTGYVHSLYVSQGTSAPWLVEGDVSCARVAFVFNIGIGYPPSQTILDTLISRNVEATMFPMGSFARSQPDYLRALNNAGFPIGTHGDENLFLTGASDSAIRADIEASRTSIEAVIGRPLDPFHTPYAADTDNRVRGVVADAGLLPVGWKVDARDYATWATEQEVYTRIINNVYPGAIIEFHLDGPATETSTARALPRLINDLRARGYEMVTVDEISKPCDPSLPDGSTRSARVVNTGGSGLRCRTVPSATGAIITVLNEGVTVPVRGNTFGEWVPVTCAGANGWASASYLTITITSPEPPDDIVEQLVALLIQILNDILNGSP